MAVIVPANLAPDTLPRVRGVMLTRNWRGLWVVSKWPRKRGTYKNFNAWYTGKQFGLAAKMAANPEPMSYATAVFLSQGTSWLPRDILVMAAYGKLYEIELPDGTFATQAYHGPPLPAPPLTWLTSASATLNANDPAWNGYTLRQLITTAAISNPGGSGTRVTFTAQSITTGCVIGEAYIQSAAPSGDPYDFASTPIQLLFGGAPGVTIAPGTSAVSDACAYTLPAGQNVVISIYFSGVSSLRYRATQAGWSSYYKLGNSAATVNASGYTSYVNAIAVSLVETLH